MKPTKWLLGAAALFASAAFSVAPARADGPIVIKFSHVVTDAAPKGKAALKFKELAEKYTNGKVRIEVYPNSTLYKDGEELEALQLGAVQMLAPSTAKFAPLGVKQFEVMDLPYLFPNQAIYDSVTTGPFGKKMLGMLQSKGITGLAYWDNGFYVLSANKPLIKPDDLKGLKLRISGSKVDDETLRTMGALPQIMAFSELYQALASGVVDGAQNTASNYTTQKLNEVQKYITTTYHVHLQYAVIVNKKFWDGLPADIRAELEKAMDEATVYNNSIAQKENTDALAAIKATGKTEIHDPTPEEQKVWRAAMMPVYKSAEGRVGKAIIDEALKATGQAQ
ncbi:MAG: DctP family TRAP transporter solute-binding subunit [Acetobacteraceae bacterium]|nr:DctP family TRAP transporter solute-binding subunit [Acetobacteraceae bacterium]